MASPSPRLDGWKAIAGYLGRDERTAQRWRQRGLPVHLVPGGKRGTVFALTSEIDEWLTRHGANTNGSNGDDARDLHATGDVAPSAGADGSEAAPPAPPPLARAKFPTRAVLVASVVLSLAFGGLAAWRLRAHPAVVRAEVTAEGLVAWTDEGQVAFKVPRAGLLARDIDPSVVPTVKAEVPPTVDDLDGDGTREILVVVSSTNGPRIASDEIFCFSETGAIRWRHPLRQRLRFGGRDYDGPWRVTQMSITRDSDGRRRIFVPVVHEIWWPAFVISLDTLGNERLHHVNAGHVWAVERLQTNGRDALLLTGINNEYRSAFLAAVDLGAAPTVSPQSDPAFRCEQCATTLPFAYVLLPPAELGELQGRPYNRGIQVMATTSYIQVSAEELNSGTARSHFRFARTLDVQSFGMSDNYWIAHRQFEEAGKLDHSLDRCPELKARQVRAWTPAGWQVISVPNEASFGTVATAGSDGKDGK